MAATIYMIELWGHAHVNKGCVPPHASQQCVRTHVIQQSMHAPTTQSLENLVKPCSSDLLVPTQFVVSLVRTHALVIQVAFSGGHPVIHSSVLLFLGQYCLPFSLQGYTAISSVGWLATEQGG
eukprot:GHVT01025031.1.p1 GENE.GHVT01025031.1~~GHVT01025031.1.p1  ORF type:complete len:123 (+),score=0.03 GHVT01025031.1:88-456(+)